MITIAKLLGVVLLSLLTQLSFGQNAESRYDSTSKSAVIGSSVEAPAATTIEMEPVQEKVHLTYTPVTLRNIPRLSADRMMIGNTYTRYGEVTSPRGYGIQVVAFKNINNLQNYLRMFDNKDMYIQVISSNSPDQLQLYRVILGAQEDKAYVEQEISRFGKAGVQAVLRKHIESRDIAMND